MLAERSLHQVAIGCTGAAEAPGWLYGGELIGFDLTQGDPTMKSFAGFALLLLLGMAPATSPAPVVDYKVAIENTMPHDMDFYYRAADTTKHLLGTIPGYVTLEFTIKSPPTTTIVITEMGSAMPGHEIDQTVVLQADSVVAVSF